MIYVIRSNQIDWQQYFTILFEDVENVTLDFQTDLIQINNIEYFEDLFKILNEYQKNQTGKCYTNMQ